MLKYSLDHLIINNGHLFGYGWSFFSENPIISLRLRLELVSLENIEIDGEFGRQRTDVSTAFPSVAEAENAGFMLLAGIPHTPIKQAYLLWQFQDGQEIQIQIQLPENGVEVKVDRISHYRALFFKAIALQRSSGYKILFKKVWRYLSLYPKIMDEQGWEQLHLRVKSAQVVVIIDHDMGGGANLYRRERVSEYLREDLKVVLLGYHVASLQYFIEIYDQQGSKRVAVNTMSALLELVRYSKVEHIVYNCAVSFRTPLEVVGLLIALQKASQANLLVAVHDFFIACPSHFLLNNQGNYCGVPNIEQCRNCLKSHRDGFVSMTAVNSIDIWRQEWARLLAIANEVRFFSNSTKEVMKRAYPALSTATWTIVPHKLHTTVTAVNTVAGTCMHIGVVGAIGKHKGSHIIQDIVAFIKSMNLNVKITIIGTLEAKASAEFVTITGPYEPRQLPSLIEQTGANVFLFPSISAETFSYVSHELVAMGVPFACFNFGAPADLARVYSRGMVLTSMQAADILKDLDTLWRKSYLIEDK